MTKASSYRRSPALSLRVTALAAMTVTALLASGCATRSAFNYQVPEMALKAPEGASGWTDKPGWSASKWMVAAANPLATDAGYQVLKAGGSAVDAAIAVQMVLALVEPQSSGIGGGAFLMHWDGKSVEAFDGRETAPAQATDQLFIRDGKPMSFYDGVVGGRSVGVPGVLRMLEAAHKQHGTLPWRSLFQPAILLAEKGFVISPRLATMLTTEKHLSADPTARAYFYQADGRPKPAGTVLQNPALAAVLREVADRGAVAFYSGPIARDIVEKVRTHPTNPGLLTTADMAGYRPKERDATCFDYRVSKICGFPAPSSGAVTIGQILGMLATTDIATRKPTRGADGRWTLQPQAVHAYSEAARLAYADRGLYLADPDFVSIPVAGLLDPAYLRQRATLITDKSMGTAQAGTPPGARLALGPDQSPELPSTSHISVVDARGNAISMTTTIEDAFGSRQMVRGFLLNNQLTDFSFASHDAKGNLVANRVEGNKRPRSSMAPLFVFDQSGKQLEMTLGSPGGSAIINYVAKVLVGTIDWGLNVQDAISLPNFGSRNGPTELEAGRIDAALEAALKERGHTVRVMDQTSGLQGIQRTPTGWFGGADPRREGVARGE